MKPLNIVAMVVIVVALSVVFAAMKPSSPQALAATSPAFMPPSAPPREPALSQALADALRAKGPDYQPRTRHLAPDGSPRFVNRLIQQTSPYLLQHAHNPVDWHPWGDDAFALAASLGRPVLLSIGYATCHWCHVMEEESFEDLEIASFINSHYVAIKVDREERPDVDAVYMTAVQAIRHSGGWPMTVWLNPARQPYMAATYIPARDGDRGARMGFLTMLQQLEQQYSTDPQGVSAQAASLAELISKNFAPPKGGPVPPATLLDDGYRDAARSYDARFGGREGRPKFPSSFPVRLLLRQARRTGDPAALQMATHTLDAMARGGMNDQIGGGFHRYSTDNHWLVPHFEKMLYDNALLCWDYLDAYQLTGDEAYASVARETLRFVRREMTSPEGTFYAAQDADSPDGHGGREEGLSYTWTPAEVRAVLGDDADAFIAAYGITAQGNFEGRSIPSWSAALDDPRRAALQAARDQLYLARSLRPQPLLDHKVLTSWNGLMISAFARAAMVLDDPSYAHDAARAANFLLAQRADGRLSRTFTSGQAQGSAFLDDYAFLMLGLLDLYEASGDLRWIRQTRQLDQVLSAHYEDPERGGFFLNPSDGETLLAREKPVRDGAEPSGNSVAILVLLRLSALTAEDGYRARADKAFGAAGPRWLQHPLLASEALIALDFRYGDPREVVLVAGEDGAAPMLDVLRRLPLPNRVLVRVPAADVDAVSAELKVVSGKRALGGLSTAYVCRRGVCERPTTDPAQLARLLTPPKP